MIFVEVIIVVPQSGCLPPGATHVPVSKSLSFCSIGKLGELKLLLPAKVCVIFAADPERMRRESFERAIIALVFRLPLSLVNSRDDFSAQPRTG